MRLRNCVAVLLSDAGFAVCAWPDGGVAVWRDLVALIIKLQALLSGVAAHASGGTHCYQLSIVAVSLQHRAQVTRGSDGGSFSVFTRWRRRVTTLSDVTTTRIGLLVDVGVGWTPPLFTSDHGQQGVVASLRHALRIVPALVEALDSVIFAGVVHARADVDGGQRLGNRPSRTTPPVQRPRRRCRSVGDSPRSRPSVRVGSAAGSVPSALPPLPPRRSDASASAGHSASSGRSHRLGVILRRRRTRSVPSVWRQRAVVAVPVSGLLPVARSAPRGALRISALSLAAATASPLAASPFVRELPMVSL